LILEAQNPAQIQSNQSHILASPRFIAIAGPIIAPALFVCCCQDPRHQGANHTPHYCLYLLCTSKFVKFVKLVASMVATDGPLSEWDRTEVISTPYKKKSTRKQTKASQKNRDVNAHETPAYPKLTVVPLAIMTFYSVSGRLYTVGHGLVLHERSPYIIMCRKSHVAICHTMSSFLNM
jgi:hypothetical protein